MLLQIVLAADVDARLARVLDRSAASSPEVDAAVREILSDVKARGDDALLDLTERFDGVRPAALRVPVKAMDRALDRLDADLRQVIEAAAANVRRFHARQVEQSWFADEPDGVILGQRVVPMERAGLYVPGGTAFYPSSLIMNAVPAQVAGVESIAIVSPPQPDGLPHPTVLATARLLGLDEVYAVGGAQAVGALAFGTASIARADVIVGPGNVYVATAKKQVYGQVAIDSVAGPSEIVVIADAHADATHVAADLLSQAEHDARASAILLTPSHALAERVQAEVERLADLLPRRDQIAPALRDYSAAVVTETLADAIDLSNRLAPEHLEILTVSPWEVVPRIRHAGAIFLGDASSEPVGDYFAGPNHVLPTGGTARFASALGVHDFVRRQSVISYSAERLAKTGPQIIRFAQAEGLDAHALAIRTRLEDV